MHERKEAHQMKHVIDGVCGALAVLAPLQDRHSRVQTDSQRQLKYQRENKDSRF